MTPHHYQGTPLRNIWLENGFQRHQTKWGEGTSYADVEGLSRAILLEVCRSNHQLEKDGVRFLRKMLGMTQDELGKELGCSGQTIAKWEKGEIDVPVAPARFLRLLALKQVSPDLSISDAISPYDEPSPEKMLFSYTDTSGWRCADHGSIPPALWNPAPRSDAVLLTEPEVA